MKKIIYIYIILALTSCSITKENRKITPWEYPYLGIMIDAYYNTYYEYPKTLAEFIYAEDDEELKEDEFMLKTITKLKEEEKDIIWRIDSEKLIVIKDNDTIYKTVMRPGPCDKEEFEYNLGNYCRTMFYGTDGIFIYSEELELDFWKRLKETMVSKVDPGQKYGDMFLLKFTIETGLMPFCENDSLDGINKYYDTMNFFLENFVKEEHLGKVVFALPRFE